MSELVLRVDGCSLDSHKSVSDDIEANTKIKNPLILISSSGIAYVYTRSKQ